MARTSLFRPPASQPTRIRQSNNHGHFFKANKTIFELIQDIIGTNLLTKFHEDRKINVASKVLTRKNAPPPGGNVFKPNGIIFEHVQYIIWMNLLTNFHEDRTINVASRVLTRFYYSLFSHIRKNDPPFSSHFHEDRKINVASRVLTRNKSCQRTARSTIQVLDSMT
ncbi:hypothetical protein DPMN_177919 [Dreissena polymorpha]|uniref:Uncharacterized protein n=1 Tax=Dreissena polymorpha TaxID=45954 RepID=A0A9D4IM38_DREPO|nr:hypothetical protein DPMN_177919 [Dreissena polymorpha]